MTETEKHIILRCKDGDKTAFRWVVQTYQRMVFSLALKMMADEEEAKDVVQETFIHAWLGIGDYDVERPYRTNRRCSALRRATTTSRRWKTRNGCLS